MATSPLVQQYAAQLRPFTEAGWQVDFRDQPRDRAIIFAGRHADLEMQFEVKLQREDVAIPGFLDHEIAKAWQFVVREEPNRWPFPLMRIHRSPATVFEPKDWHQFLRMMGWASFDREQIKNEVFRRHNHIVLATPFKDKTDRPVYELDRLHHQRDGYGTMVWDEAENDWRVVMHGRYRLLGSAASDMRRVGSAEEFDQIDNIPLSYLQQQRISLSEDYFMREYLSQHPDDLKRN